LPAAAKLTEAKLTERACSHDPPPSSLRPLRSDSSPRGRGKFCAAKLTENALALPLGELAAARLTERVSVSEAD